MRWRAQNRFEQDLEKVVRQLEHLFAYVNDQLLAATGISRDNLVDHLVDVQAKILGFDAHTQAKFHTLIEERRVRTLSHGSIFAACVLCSAVALSEFKHQPVKLGNWWSGHLGFLQRRSTNPLTLLGLSAASFTILFGKKGVKQLAKHLRNRPIELPQKQR